MKLADFGSALSVKEVPTLGVAKLKGCSPHFIAPEVRIENSTQPTVHCLLFIVDNIGTKGKQMLIKGTNKGKDLCVSLEKGVVKVQMLPLACVWCCSGLFQVVLL